MTVASPSPGNPRQNHLLAALPEAEWERWQHWQPGLELVELQLGQVLCESGSTPTHVIFPTTAIVSLLYLTQAGESSEIAVVGNDGVVGISLFMGGNATPSRSVVQSAGHGYRLQAQRLKEEAARAGPTLQMLLRYTQALIAQVAQTAACNRYYSVDQLLCRRLLLGLDRAPADGLVMTQELLANLLGVRREGITAAALRLQQDGVISYRRGHIAVLDRERLKQRTGNRCNASRTIGARTLPASLAFPAPPAPPRPQPPILPALQSLWLRSEPTSAAAFA